MRVIFLCKTPYQIMTATRIAMEEHKSDTVDIMLFDCIANVETLTEGIRKCGIFENLYIFHLGKYISKYKIVRFFAPIFQKVINLTDEVYDAVYFSNIYDWIVNGLIVDMRNRAQRAGKNLNAYMFEDGFSTYSEHYGDFFHEIATHKIVKLKNYHKIYQTYYHLRGLYVFTPELVDWKPDFEIRPVKKISENDTDYFRVINTIFGYDTMEDTYDRDIIFFEESYFADGMDIGDVGVVENIAERVGRDKLFVKIHPRNPVNRFGEMGLKTNRNTAIPWEVIAMNIDLKDKILITIASGSALTSLVNINIMPKKIIMLMNCREIDDDKLTTTLPMLRKIAEHYPDVVLLPQSYDEFYSCLEQYIK